MDFLGFKFESLKLNSDVYGEEKRQIEVRHFFFGFFYFYWKKIKEPDLKAELRPGTNDSGSASRRSSGPMRSRIHHTMKVVCEEYILGQRQNSREIRVFLEMELGRVF